MCECETKGLETDTADADGIIQCKRCGRCYELRGEVLELVSRWGVHEERSRLVDAKLVLDAGRNR